MKKETKNLIGEILIWIGIVVWAIIIVGSMLYFKN